MLQRRKNAMPLRLYQEHVLKLVKLNSNGVPTVQRRDDAIMELATLGLAKACLELMGAEEVVPEKEDSTVVLAKDVLILRVVNPMRGGRVEYDFDDAWTLWNQRRVDPILAYQLKLVHGGCQQWREHKGEADAADQVVGR